MGNIFPRLILVYMRKYMKQKNLLVAMIRWSPHCRFSPPIDFNIYLLRRDPTIKLRSQIDLHFIVVSGSLYNVFII
jgi:hypothetical protein